MTDIQRWTASFDYESLDGVIAKMNRCNAFEKSLGEFRLLNPVELPAAE